MTAPYAEELRALELRLLEPGFRRDREAVAALLAEDFVEYGSSGRVFSREQILDLLAAENQHRIELADFQARLLAPHVALVTWRSIRAAGPPHPGAESLRSSVWIRRDHRWQMLFHQGTRIPAP